MQTIAFHNWQIAAPQDIFARQFDHKSRAILVSGDLPEGWDWFATVQKGDLVDLLALEPMEGGFGVVLTEQQLAYSGLYYFQLKGTRPDGTVQHTNVVELWVPASLTGEANWPEIPSAFSQLEARIRDYTSHPPVPGESGFWTLWDPETQTYVPSSFPLPVVICATLLDDTLTNPDAAAQAKAVGDALAEKLALDSSGNLNLQGGKIQNLSPPTEKLDAATKQYVDTSIPKTLPNPHALILNGIRYDGVEPQEITIQDGGGYEEVTIMDVTTEEEVKTITGPVLSEEECQIVRNADVIQYYCEMVPPSDGSTARGRLTLSINNGPAFYEFWVRPVFQDTVTPFANLAAVHYDTGNFHRNYIFNSFQGIRVRNNSNNGNLINSILVHANCNGDGTNLRGYVENTNNFGIRTRIRIYARRWK